MRGGRSLLILLVIALGLGAYIYFVESERDPAGTVTRDAVFDVERDDIVSLSVRGSAADAPTTLRRGEGEGWTVVEPVTAEADNAAVEAILGGLESLEIERVIDENPTGLSQFGLEPADLEIGFTTADGTSRTLMLGAATPTGSGLYARTDDDPRLLLVPSYHKSTFDKSTFDLRNRRVLDVAQATVERVELARRGEPSVELRRANGAWRLAAPLEARADAGPADSLVSRLSTAQMSSIVHEHGDPTAAQLREWGLDTPRLTATLGSGSTTATLAIGAERDGSSVYARDLSRPLVFTVDQALVTDLTKSADDFRVRDVFAFNAFSAQRLELAHSGTTRVWEKASPGDDGQAQPAWSQVEPSAGDVNQTAMTDLLNALSAIRAERFAADAPTAGETIEVAVRFGASGAQQEEAATLRLSDGQAWAVRPGEAGAAVISVEDFEAVRSHLETLTAAASDGQ